MCVSCGCGAVNDDHGDSRNITLDNLDEAAQAAGTTRGRVIQNISQVNETISSAAAQGAQTGRGDYYSTAQQSMQQAGAQSGDEAPDVEAAPDTGWSGQQVGAQSGNAAPDIGWQMGQQTGLNQEENPLTDL